MTSKGEGAPRRYTPRLPPEVRRDQILDAVLEVISEHGTTAVTVDGIARRLGFTRPVVYALFDDADHLLRESLKREEQRALAQIIELVTLPPRAGATPDAVADIFRAYLQAVLDEPTRWRAILLPIGTPPALLRTMRRGRDQIVGLVSGYLATTGLAAAGLDPELVAHAVVTLAEEAGRLVLTDPESHSPERLAQFVHTAAQLVAGARVG